MRRWLKKLGDAEAVALEVSTGRGQPAPLPTSRNATAASTSSSPAPAPTSPATSATQEHDGSGWDDVVAINLNGLFYCRHAVIPHAQAQGRPDHQHLLPGARASSLTGPAYNATKRAVIAITESINMEECMHGIRATLDPVVRSPR
jgi:NAD(P)-dependent dehydrogenase (short-subunit alcohol dehydrogenase family)